MGGAAALYRVGGEGLVEGEVGGGVCVGWGWGQGGFWRGMWGAGAGGGAGAWRGRRVQDCRLGLQNIKHQDSSFIHNILLAFGFDFR